jgi:hypothetical protein
MKMKSIFTMVAVLVGLLAGLVGPATADDAQKARLERAGNCNDAKSQMAYFCRPDDGTDTMLTLGTACNNSKNNVKLACEGIDTPDPEYKFDDKK